MKKYSLIIIAVLTCSLHAIAQDDKQIKILKKAYGLLGESTLEDAGNYLDKALVDNPSFGMGWDLLAKIRQRQYQLAKSEDKKAGKFKVTVDGEDPDENDSLANQFMELLNSVKPSKIAYNKMINTMRRATLQSNNAYQSSLLLRIYEVDPEMDSGVSKAALKIYNQADDEFGLENYEKAAKLYTQALAEQPDYYKAKMYLGFTYYSMGEYEQAISSLKETIEKHPRMIEPKKYLLDSYSKSANYTEAINVAFDALTVYPDLAISAKLDTAVQENKQKLDIKWTPRPVFPNKMAASTDDDKLSPKGPWVYYTKALPKIREFCDEKGIITKSNSLTESKYLEVYSWEEMLKNSKDPLLDEARRMQSEGYLDCYVMVTCFHYDFYDQYLDFISKNKQRLIEYHKKFMVDAK